MKSGYLELPSEHDASAGPGTGRVIQWHKIWELRVIPKIHFSLWKFLHDILPSNINLVSRFVDVNSMCVRCGDQIESTEHVFKECWWVAEVWKFYSVKMQLSEGSIVDWVESERCRLQEEEFCMFITFLWFICYARNVRIFEVRHMW